MVRCDAVMLGKAGYGWIRRGSVRFGKPWRGNAGKLGGKSKIILLFPNIHYKIK